VLIPLALSNRLFVLVSNWPGRLQVA